jgi:hypothetical protein
MLERAGILIEQPLARVEPTPWMGLHETGASHSGSDEFGERCFIALYPLAAYKSLNIYQ